MGILKCITLSAMCLLAYTVRSIHAQCIVTTAGPLTIEGAPAIFAQLASPLGIAFDGGSVWYISDSMSDVIRRLYSNGTMSTVLGIARSTVTFNGDNNSPLLTALNNPTSIVHDGAGGCIFADVSQWVVCALPHPYFTVTRSVPNSDHCREETQLFAASSSTGPSLESLETPRLGLRVMGARHLWPS